MGNRMLKETIRTSRSVNQLSDFQFRLWIHLITYVDDYGRGSADPELLKGFVFPRRKGVTETTIANALADLATSGMIQLYEVGGESFFCFPNWGEHQRIQTRKSKFPAPEDGEEILPQVTESHGESRKVTVNHGDSPSETKPKPNTKPKSKEKEKEGAQARFVPPTVEETDTFFTENGGTLMQAMKFRLHYSSNGWKVGKVPMKDWKSAARGWMLRDKEGGMPSSQAGRSAGQDTMMRYTPEERKATYSAAVVDFDEG